MSEVIDYEQILTALATYVFAYSEKENGLVINDHYSCNGFELAPDILERSKIMASQDLFQNSWFIVNWKPGDSLPVYRNSHEASLPELKLALVTAVRWGQEENSEIKQPITQTKPDSDPAPGMHHYPYAIWLIARCLEELKLGDFVDPETFILNHRGMEQPPYHSYWTEENNKRRNNRKILSKQTQKKLCKIGRHNVPDEWYEL